MAGRVVCGVQRPPDLSIDSLPNPSIGLADPAELEGHDASQPNPTHKKKDGKALRSKII